ncbi:MAG: DUF2304 domain-containing protein [TACK group archaeon]|nr:DUF2304 domain-containing protein [TACK group archaeon]
MHFYSYLADALAVIFIAYTYVQAKRGKFGRGESAIWVMVWLLVGVFATFPWLFSAITVYFGIALPINLFYGLFSVFLLFMIYRLEERVNELQKVVLKAVQDRAIEEAKDEPHNA